MRRAWIVPRADRSTLCMPAVEQGYRDGAPRLADVRDLPMPLLAPHVLDLDADLLVFAGEGRLEITHGLQGGAASHVSLRLPRRIKINALLAIDGVIYAGGLGGREVIGKVDLRDEPRWEPLPLPEGRWALGKGIDGFALHEGRLVAVDDIVLPRYLLVYDVNDPRAPKLLEARDLPAHSSAERVTAVAADGAALAVLSTTANRARLSVHVALYDLATLAERAVLHAQHTGSLRAFSARRVDFSSLALAGDALLIAAGAEGIGVLDVRPWLADAGKIAEIPMDAVRFVPVAPGRVIRVVPVDAASAIAVVETKSGAFRRAKLDSVLVPLA